MEHQIDPDSYTVTAIAVVMILLMGVPLLGQYLLQVRHSDCEVTYKSHGNDLRHNFNTIWMITNP